MVAIIVLRYEFKFPGAAQVLDDSSLRCNLTAFPRNIYSSSRGRQRHESQESRLRVHAQIQMHYAEVYYNIQMNTRRTCIMCKGDRLSSNSNRYENSRLKSLRVENCKLCTELTYANMDCRLQNLTHGIPMTKRGRF